MRNLPSDYHGRNFLVKDRLFMEEEMTQQVSPSLKYLVCPAAVPLILTNETCGGNHHNLSIDIFIFSAGKKLTMHQFLNRLPKVVVKAGRVIDIRDSLRATLQVNSWQEKSYLQSI